MIKPNNYARGNILTRNMGSGIYASLLSQVYRSRLPLFVALAVLAVVFGIVLLLNLSLQVPIARMSRDPAAILNAPVYTGLLSNLGVVFWSAAASACLMGALALSEPDGRLRRFLLVSGVFTLLLMLDDLFLFHEVLVPKLTGIGEKWVLLSYMGLMASIFIGYFRVIIATQYVMLALSLFCFSLSIFFDKIFTMFGEIHVLEDGAKFSGIVIWFIYFASVSIGSQKINQKLASSESCCNSENIYRESEDSSLPL